MIERERSVGVLLKSTDVVTEGDLTRLCPAPLRLHMTRVALEPGEDFDSIEASLKPACAQIADAQPELVILACASATFAGGVTLDQKISERIGALTGCPVITAASAIVDGAQRLGMRRVLLMSPYSDAIDAGIRNMFETVGMEVADILGLRPKEIFQPAFLERFPGTGNRLIDPAWIPEMASQALTAVAGVDGIVIACTGLRVSEILATLEQYTELPVVAANQATAAAVQQALNLQIPVTGFGGLLEALP
jgi:maleate isomerase|tara:strand:- start:190 stop:939 length:750 start_codon:yes stop_codon:yes gene_type:complete